MSSLTIAGAVGFGLPVGWAAVNPIRARSRLFTIALSFVVAPLTVLLLISPAAAIASLAGVLAGCALRLLFHFVLVRKATPHGRR